MAQIQFLAGLNNNAINNLSGSGLGFYNSSFFGGSLAIGTYNGRTFITDSTGTQQGPETTNNQYLAPSTVIIGQVGSGVNCLCLPNYLSSLNVRFTNGSPVVTTNVQCFAYDRVSLSNAPSGISMKILPVIHPTLTQVTNGSGTSTWQDIGVSGLIVSLVSSPGTSGFSPNGTATSDTTHDWFLGLSCTATSVGAKEFSLAISLEYL